MTDIGDLLDMNAEPWKPNPGDKVVGKLVKVSYIEGKEFAGYPLYELQTDDGTLVEVHAFHQVLQNEIHRQNVTEGDRLGIKYLGKADGKKYENYRVLVERGDGPRPEKSEPEQTIPLGTPDDEEFSSDPF